MAALRDYDGRTHNCALPIQRTPLRRDKRFTREPPPPPSHAPPQPPQPAQPAQPAQMPPTTIRPLPNTTGIMPIESARQQQVPQRLLLEAPERPKRDIKGMDDVRAVLEKAKAKENSAKFLQSAQSELNALRAQSQQEVQATDNDTIVLQQTHAPTRTIGQRFKNMFKRNKKYAKVAPANNRSYYENDTEQLAAPAPAAAPALIPPSARRAALAKAVAPAPAAPAAPAAPVAPVAPALSQLDSAINDHEAAIRELNAIIAQKTGEYQTKKDQAVNAGKQRNTAKSNIVKNLARKKALNFTRSAKTINGELTKNRQRLAALQESLQKLQSEKTKLEAAGKARNEKVLANAQAALKGAREQDAAISRIIQPRISPEEEASLQAELNAL